MKALFFTFLFMVPSAWAMDLELSGQHRARGVYYEQGDYSRDVKDIFTQRFKLKGAFSPNEVFESHFWMMTNYNWGDTNYKDAELRIYGYGDWKVSDEFMIRVGRAPYEIGHGTSMGINDYEKYPYVLDGLFLTYNTDNMIVDVWAAYLPKVFRGAVEEEKYRGSLGVALDIRAVPGVLKTATIYGIYADEVEQDDQYTRIGVDIGGDLDMVGYKVSAAAHGYQFNIDQWAVDAKLSYNFDFDARIYIGGHYESDNYDPFYHNRHSYAGKLDVAALGNGTVYGKAGIGYSPVENFEIGLLGLYFHSVGSWGQWAHAAQEGNTLSKEDVVELDLYIKKAYAGGFKIKLSGGLFDAFGQDTPYWQAQLNTTFDF